MILDITYDTDFMSDIDTMVTGMDLEGWTDEEVLASNGYDLDGLKMLSANSLNRIHYLLELLHLSSLLNPYQLPWYLCLT